MGKVKRLRAADASREHRIRTSSAAQFLRDLPKI
jgi:hypothetical protein